MLYNEKLSKSVLYNSLSLSLSLFFFFISVIATSISYYENKYINTRDSQKVPGKYSNIMLSEKKNEKKKSPYHKNTITGKTWRTWLGWRNRRRWSDWKRIQTVIFVTAK